ncbi:MAG TPA: hypothetical protein VFT78_06110 [Hanamia sp.]|nr:hypothetical protein [Hanamia sp.]
MRKFTLHNFFLVAFFVYASVSCNKSATTNNTNRISTLQLPDTIRHIVSDNINPKILSSTYTFPNGFQKNRIEYDRYDTFFTNGNASIWYKTNVVHDFDPTTGHLIGVASRSGKLIGDSVSTGQFKENFDNSFLYSNGKQYPDAVSVIYYSDRVGDIYQNYLLSNEPPASLPDFYYHLYQSQSASSYLIMPVDSGLVRLVQHDNSSNDYLFSGVRNGLVGGPDDQFWYYFDKNNYIRECIFQSGYTEAEPSGVYFHPNVEMKTDFLYDINSDTAEQLLNNVIQSKDVFAYDMAIDYSNTDFKFHTLDLWKAVSSNYTDSFFLIDANNVKSFYSVQAYRNERARDAKGRISSINKLNRAGRVIEQYVFAYKK